MPTAWDERTQLTTFLDYARDTARAKCEDLSEADARKAPLPHSPLMTPSGLVNHLRWVEYYWFRVVFLGEEDEGPWTDEDPDREMRIAVDLPSRRCSTSTPNTPSGTGNWSPSTTSPPRRSGRRATAGMWTCAGSSCTWSRRRPGTTATSTSCAN